VSRLASNTLTLLIGNAGSTVLSLLLSILIGRVLGQPGLGIYAAALAWVYPVALLAEAGLSILITRDLAQSGSTQPENAAREVAYLLAAAKARLLLGSVGCGFLLISAALLTQSPLTAAGLRLSAPLVLITPFYSAFSAVFRARRQMRPVALLNTGMLVVQVGLTALVFLFGGDVITALVVNTLTSAGQLIAAYLVWRRGLSIPETAASLPLWPVLRRALPFAIGGILAAVQLRLNVILLEQLTNPAAVGGFAAASRFLEGGRLLSLAFFDALLPALSSLAAQPPLLNQTFRRAAMVSGGFGFAFGLVLTFLAAPLLRLTYGADFAANALTLTILGWSLLPLALKYTLTLYWYARGREGYANAVTLAIIVVQLALGLTWIPRYSAAGAALASVTAEIVGAILMSLPLLSRSNGSGSPKQSRIIK
jgi:O-antigen/teichoic acid export membrane protein